MMSAPLGNMMLKLSSSLPPFLPSSFPTSLTFQDLEQKLQIVRKKLSWSVVVNAEKELGEKKRLLEKLATKISSAVKTNTQWQGQCCYVMLTPPKIYFLRQTFELVRFGSFHASHFSLVLLSTPLRCDAMRCDARMQRATMRVSKS
jgi:hypothetical protein